MSPGELRKVAEKADRWAGATWHADEGPINKLSRYGNYEYGGGAYVYELRSDGRVRVVALNVASHHADYLAAVSPDVIIALLDRFDAAEAELQQRREDEGLVAIIVEERDQLRLRVAALEEAAKEVTAYHVFGVGIGDAVRELRSVLEKEAK